MNAKPSPVTIEATPKSSASGRLVRGVSYLLVGIYFGIILIKGQVADWFRIQEMFRLQQFHMFGIIGSAILTAMVSVWLLRRLNARSGRGDPISVGDKTSHKGQLIGGFIFGLGWAATGACPGPLFAQIGSGATVMILALGSALVGTWIYGWLRPHLPH
jgi:uncharacterized membrane protein YedE/YeeE